MTYQITNQRDLRKAFWRENHNRYPRGKNMHGDYNVDTRMAFVDYIDHCARDGVISQELAQRATL